MWLWKRNYATYDNSNNNIQQKEYKNINDAITYCFNDHTDNTFDILKEIFTKEEI